MDLEESVATILFALLHPEGGNLREERAATLSLRKGEREEGGRIQYKVYLRVAGKDVNIQRLEQPTAAYHEVWIPDGCRIEEYWRIFAARLSQCLMMMWYPAHHVRRLSLHWDDVSQKRGRIRI